MSTLLKQGTPTSNLEDLTAFLSSSGLTGPGRPAQSLLLRDRGAAVSLPEPVGAPGGSRDAETSPPGAQEEGRSSEKQGSISLVLYLYNTEHQSKQEKSVSTPTLKTDSAVQHW